MERIGMRLHTIRQQWRLSLREVQKRSLRLAEEWGDQSYKVSAGWLDRLEREEHELTVNKLMALAYIYGVGPEQLLRFTHPGNAQSASPRQPFNPEVTILTEDPAE
jgi:transcriptional regulator with XRE-family HTH domain